MSLHTSDVIVVLPTVAQQFDWFKQQFDWFKHSFRLLNPEKLVLKLKTTFLISFL